MYQEVLRIIQAIEHSTSPGEIRNTSLTAVVVLAGSTDRTGRPGIDPWTLLSKGVALPASKAEVEWRPRGAASKGRALRRKRGNAKPAQIGTRVLLYVLWKKLRVRNGHANRLPL